MKLRTAMIFVKDVERMTAFYRDGLELAPLPGASSPGWIVLDAGGCRLALHAIAAEIARGIRVTTPPEPRSETALKLVFATRDLESDCQRLLALGATLAQRRGPGLCDLLDPEGNVFQLALD
jgi:catechol 2,3-dioxygenase-like lactoylglutathione lyase family enzyme